MVKTKIKVLVIDDLSSGWTYVRNSLANAGLEEYEMIGGLFDYDKDALNQFVHTSADDPAKEELTAELVFLDKKFDGDRTRGVRIARKIKSKFPETKIIMMTDNEDKLDFIDVHSEGLIDGYIRKKNFRSRKVLRSVLSGAKDNHPFWDVPPHWLKYELKENLPHLIRTFAREKKLAEKDVDMESKAFKAFQRDEYLRFSSDGYGNENRSGERLTILQWKIFKLVARGFDHQEIVKRLGSHAHHVHLQHIRRKLCIPNKNQCWFLIRAIQMNIPEVVEMISGLTDAEIIFPDHTDG